MFITSDLKVKHRIIKLLNRCLFIVMNMKKLRLQKFKKGIGAKNIENKVWIQVGDYRM